MSGFMIHVYKNVDKSGSYRNVCRQNAMFSRGPNGNCKFYCMIRYITLPCNWKGIVFHHVLKIYELQYCFTDMEVIPDVCLIFIESYTCLYVEYIVYFASILSIAFVGE